MLSEGLRRVCPIHPHFLFFTSWLMVFWLVLSNRLAFDILSGHLMFRILLRHLLTKVWSFLVVIFVTLHVSDPWRRTDFTLVLNILV